MNTAFIARILVCGITLGFATTRGAEPEADIADMKVSDLRAGGDEKKRYFTIQCPGEAPKLAGVRSSSSRAGRAMRSFSHSLPGTLNMRCPKTI